MAKDKTVKLEVKSNINEVTKGFEKTQKEIKKTESTVKSLDKTLTDTGKKFNKTQKQTQKNLRNTRKEVDKVNENIKKVSGGLKGVSAGFETAEGAMALFGAESENVGVAMDKLREGMNITQSIKTFKDGTKVIKEMGVISKVAAGFQWALSTAIGGTSGALKIFRLALIATGLGAIVVGIGMLVANFDKLKDVLGGSSKGFKDASIGVKILTLAFLPLNLAIDLVKKGLQALGIIESEEDKAKEKRHKDNIKRIEKENEARKQRHQERQNEFDREIAMLEAEGKSSFALRQQKLADSIAVQKQEAKAMESTIKMFETYAKVVGENTGVLKELKEELKGVNEDIKNQENELKINVVKNNKDKLNSYKEYNNQRLEMARKIEDLENDLLKDGEQKEIILLQTKFKRLKQDIKGNFEERKRIMELYTEQEQQAIAEIQQKFRDEKKAKDDEAFNEEFEELKQMQEEFAKIKRQNEDLFRSEQQNEVLITEEKYDKLLAMAQDDAEAQEQIDIARRNALNDIAIKYENIEDARNKARTDKKKADDAKELKDAKELAMAKAELGIQGLNLLAAIAERNAGDDEKRQKRAFQIKKVADIASATLDGYKAVLSTYAQTPGGPVIKGIAAAVSGAFAAIQIANIAKQEFQGGGGNIAPTPDPGSGSESIAPSFNIVSDSGINDLEGLGEQPPIQAYVTSQDVTTAQGLDRARVQNATI